MCGIVGIFADKNAQEIALEGLSRLEYRGYDSAGIASINNGQIECIKTVGKIDLLKEKYKGTPVHGQVCIGHTRWATHGKKKKKNAHPIIAGHVAVVHNGIIENCEALKKELLAEGRKFVSDTDTEVVAHLLDKYFIETNFSPLEAVLKTVNRLHGAFALCIVFDKYNDLIFGVKEKSPLVAGNGANAMLCSDIVGLAGVCDEVTYLDDKEIACIKAGSLSFYDFDGHALQKSFAKLAISESTFDKGEYPNFMIKEIMEQPKALKDTIEAVKTTLPAGIDKITILACGSSYYAGYIAKYWFEKYLGVQTNVEFASEYGYRDSVVNDKEMFIAISQSGESSDTIAAINKVKGRGKVTAIVNVKNSAIARLADSVIYTEAGPEIGVAATKSFTAQLAALASLCMNKDLLGDIPDVCSHVINKAMPAIESVAQEIIRHKNAIFVGRGLMYPAAMEAALKMKELSYIHAEAFAAGELKHGPLALIDDDMPVIVFAPSDGLFQKSMSTVREILSRGRNVVVVMDENSNTTIDGAQVIKIPAIGENLAPFTFAIVGQLLAYHSALYLGRDVDRPRNLAKSVTVE